MLEYQLNYPYIYTFPFYYYLPHIFLIMTDQFEYTTTGFELARDYLSEMRYLPIEQLNGFDGWSLVMLANNVYAKFNPDNTGLLTINQIHGDAESEDKTE